MFVPCFGNERRSTMSAFLAMAIRSPPILPLLSTRKRYSCDSISGSLNLGTSERESAAVSCSG